MHGNCQHFFRFVLPDNIFIQLGFDLGGCRHFQVADKFLYFGGSAGSGIARCGLFAFFAAIEHIIANFHAMLANEAVIHTGDHFTGTAVIHGSAAK